MKILLTRGSLPLKCLRNGLSVTYSCVVVACGWTWVFWRIERKVFSFVSESLVFYLLSVMLFYNSSFLSQSFHSNWLQFGYFCINLKQLFTLEPKKVLYVTLLFYVV